MAMINVSALILRRHRFSETSLVASVLTRERGRMDFLAKGCLREKSPMFGHLDYYQHEALLILERPGAGLDLAIEAAFIDEHPGLRFFPPAFAAAGYLSELALAAVMPQDPHPGLFDNLAEAFAFLSDLGEPAVQAGLAEKSAMTWEEKIILTNKILRLMTLKTLSFFGFAPMLDRCVHCGRLPPFRSYAVSRRAGGLICPDCRAAAGGARLSSKAYAALQAAAAGREYDEIALGSQERRELLRFLVDYSQYVVEKQLHSAKTLFQLVQTP